MSPNIVTADMDYHSFNQATPSSSCLIVLIMYMWFKKTNVVYMEGVDAGSKVKEYAALEINYHCCILYCEVVQPDT